MCESGLGDVVRDVVNIMGGRDCRLATLQDGVTIQLDMMRTI